MKLSFSLQSKQSSSSTKPKLSFTTPNSNQPETKPTEYLTEFDPSKPTPQTLTPGPKHPTIIPPKQNEWRPTKKMKNLDLPSLQQKENLEFEKESSVPPPEPGSHISYGLNVRQQQEILNNGMHDSSKNNIDDIMMKKLKTDIERLPDEEGFDQFDEVPVDGYGAALLAGYGWKEGMGIGRNAKEDVKVVEYKKRTAKEGLGFTSESGPPKKKNDSGDVEGRVRFEVGKEVRVIGGKEVGVKGRVIEVVGGGEEVLVKVSRREVVVKVGVSEVAEVGSVEEEKCLRKLKELRITRSGNGSTSKKKDSGGGSGVAWLASHIRVRIVSKKIKKGRLYLKKGEVVDVVGPRMCDIRMDEGREIVQGVEQDMLETALPKRGGPVLVLFGKYKGVYGSLVEKDSERETGVVQDADTRELIHVRLEQIAEYVGDPSYIGY